MKVLHIVGARPNFMKAAAVIRAVAEKGWVPPLWDGHASDRIASILCGRGC